MILLRRRTTAQDLVDTVQKAVADATLAARFDAHQQKCEEDKAEIKKTLDDQDLEQRLMHKENSQRFEKLEDRLSAFSWRVIGWVIGAQAVLISAASTVIWALVSHKLGAS